MQQAVFMAHCPYELGDIVEVAIIEGMAITGYPRRLGTAEMQITDIITEHSLKNGTVYGGRSIMFEAKRTSKDRITRNVLTDTQMDVLEKHSRLGALCGVCICIQDDFFFIPWNVWRDMKEMYGRQYLKPDDIEEYKVKFDGAVHFLMHTEELKGAYENAERKR